MASQLIIFFIADEMGMDTDDIYKLVVGHPQNHLLYFTE